MRPGSDPGGSETILVVEDDPDVAEMAEAALGGLGYRTITAGDGPAALDLLRAGADVDLLFTDVVMPHGMTGVALARAARALRPGLRVLLTSGYAANDRQAIAGDIAVWPFLSKPYRQGDLAAKVRLVLDKG
jgi:CheY-like chemotaxis protein